MKKSVLVIIFLISCTFIAAQDSGKLKRVQDKFNSVKSLSADISQVEGTSKLKGRIFFKPENNFRMELDNMTIVSNGTAIWNYNKKTNKVIIDDFTSDGTSALSIQNIINEYPLKSDISYQKESGREVLVLTPKKGSGLDYDRIMLWINEEELPERIKVFKAGSPAEILISNYKLNQDIPDSQFSFMPPQGSQVIDLR